MAKMLLIEDEAELMTGTVKSIKRKGYDLDIATTGAQAMAMLSKSANTYDIVILDLMLPRGKSECEEDIIPQMEHEKVGQFVLERIAERWPFLPVVVLTAVRSDLKDLKIPPRCTLLMKPVLLSELFNTIRQIM